MACAAAAAASGRSPCKRRGCGAEELRARRRAREAALRSTRRLQQLISKRLLREETLTGEERAGTDGEAAAPLSGEEVSQLLRNIQRGAHDRAAALRCLREGLQHGESQKKFIRLEGGVRVLIGLFTSQQADLQMDAARCLHELSHSSDADVVAACLPATSYLLTYLSGHSAALMELCLYTLGNLAVEAEAVRTHLLPQGIIPAMASCIQSPHVAVQEGVGYVLAQLLQAREAPAEITPRVLNSTLLQDMLRLVCSDLEKGIGAAVEFAWGLHYIVCSRVNNPLLISLRTVPSLAQRLVELASTIPTASPECLELLVCPVVRCLGNLLAEETAEWGEPLAEEGGLLWALSVFIQHFLPTHFFIVRECLWLINNLTVGSTASCSALLNLDVFPTLLTLLSSHQMVSLLVLTVLCNVAVKGADYCQALHQKAVLPSLISTLGLPDAEVVGQDLELLHLLFLHCPEATTDFVAQSGLQALEQHQNNLQLQERVTALIQIASQRVTLAGLSP